jgi:hypothetical protein
MPGPAISVRVNDPTERFITSKSGPVTRQTFDLPDFGDSLAVRSIRGLPKRHRVGIPVVTEDIYPPVADAFRKQICHPRQSLRVTETKDASPGAFFRMVQDPLWMLAGDDALGCNSLGIEPE